MYLSQLNFMYYIERDIKFQQMCTPPHIWVDNELSQQEYFNSPSF